MRTHGDDGEIYRSTWLADYKNVTKFQSQNGLLVEDPSLPLAPRLRCLDSNQQVLSGFLIGKHTILTRR